MILPRLREDEKELWHAFFHLLSPLMGKDRPGCSLFKSITPSFILPRQGEGIEGSIVSRFLYELWNTAALFFKGDTRYERRIGKLNDVDRCASLSTFSMQNSSAYGKVKIQKTLRNKLR